MVMQCGVYRFLLGTGDGGGDLLFELFGLFFVLHLSTLIFK